MLNILSGNDKNSIVDDDDEEDYDNYDDDDDDDADVLFEGIGNGTDSGGEVHVVKQRHCMFYCVYIVLYTIHLYCIVNE